MGTTVRPSTADGGSIINHCSCGSPFGGSRSQVPGERCRRVSLFTWGGTHYGRRSRFGPGASSHKNRYEV